jgi:hypothetical protein
MGYTPGEEGRSITIYIEAYCHVGAQKMSSQIAIQDIRDLPLKTILFYINWDSGSTTHLTSRSNMQVALMCLQPIIFSWSEGIMLNNKNQLTRCKQGRHN